ncbi:MAG: hypothetical protein LAO77_11175 [Acidobacteriia bacterium]|nr:hypothetical protein [Terriglobia bacterium]
MRNRNRFFAAVAFVTVMLAPSPARAWGFTGHRYIMGRAIDLLPAPLKPFFERYRAEMVVRAIDPDLWRNVGWEDDPNHFMDFGAREFGPPPFTAMPREYGAALGKFGEAALKRLGMLPWREAEMFGNLRRGFEGFARGGRYSPNDVALFAPVMGHYIQDANQPLHASNNYDGQLTGNTGVHSRFEAELLERYLARLTINPAPPRSVTSARDAAFDALIAANRSVDTIIKADSDAIAGRDAYDDVYFEKFFAAVKPILEKQLAAAITDTASLIISAWEQAGKPALALEGARPVQKKK